MAYRKARILILGERAVTQPILHTSDLVRVFIDQQGALRALLMRRLGDEEEVLDLLQELFLRASQFVSSGEPIVNPVHYLRRVATNLAIDHQRKRIRWNKLFATGKINDQQHFKDMAGPTPEEITQARQRLSLMQDVLDTLPKDCRTAFLLSRCDGLTYEEIGKRLGVSRNMVKKHLVRALAELRASMPLMR